MHRSNVAVTCRRYRREAKIEQARRAEEVSQNNRLIKRIGHECDRQQVKVGEYHGNKKIKSNGPLDPMKRYPSMAEHGLANDRRQHDYKCQLRRVKDQID